jgi:hypothetical protein
MVELPNLSVLDVDLDDGRACVRMRAVHRSKVLMSTIMKGQLTEELLGQVGRRLNKGPVQLGASIAYPECLSITHALVDTELDLTRIDFAWVRFRGRCEDGKVRPIGWNRHWREETGRYERLALVRSLEIIPRHVEGEGAYYAITSSIPGTAGWNDDGFPMFRAIDFSCLLSGVLTE